MLLSAGGLALSLHYFQLRLTLPDELGVEVGRDLPVRTAIEKPIEVSVDERLSANVRLSHLSIPIDETMEFPLRMQIDIPIDTEIDIDQKIDVATVVPIELVLTEKELDLSQLMVPIDTEIFVQDEIDVDTVVPIDTKIETTMGIMVPVKARIPLVTKLPIKQKIRVHDTIPVAIKKLRVPLSLRVPVNAQVPIKERFHVRGRVRAPIDQRVRIPIHQTITPELDEPITATVQLEGKVPARLRGSFEADVGLDGPIGARLSPFAIDIDDVAIERRPDR